MNGGRITSDDTSRISLSIGVGVAVVLLAGVLYFIFVAYSKVRETTGFDPNRPVPSDAALRARLKAEQYHVVRENGTETPFKNEFWNNEHAGLYADIITGEPLFTSMDKLNSVTGQLTFAKPISKDLVVEKPDLSHNMQRTEVRARRSDAHLGHVFDDPTSQTHQRYSVNSAAFRFIPREKMEKQGYSAYVSLFGEKK